MKILQHPKFLNLFLMMVLCANWIGCERGSYEKNKFKIDEKPVISQDSEKIRIIKQAKLFLHLLKGREAVEYYDDPKRLPEVIFFPDKNTWNVFFNYPGGGFNIELNSDASKANYHFLNGFVLRENIEDKVDPDNIPLFTLVEMMELFNLPHNKRNKR